MADPFSISVGVLSVIGAACSSCKILGDIVRGYKDAPISLKSLGQELDAVERQLISLSDVLNREMTNLTSDQRACFENLEVISRQCESSVNSFKSKLTNLTSHSTAGHISARDKAKVHLKDKDIAQLKAKLERYKQTFDIAVGIATLSVPDLIDNIIYNM